MYTTIRAGIKQSNGLWAILAMLLALFASSAEAADMPLTIHSQPGNTTVYEGEPVKFIIKATSSRPIHYTWYKNGRAVGRDSYILPVSNPTKYNEGNFTCRVTDGKTTLVCKPFTFTVLSKTTTATGAATSNLAILSQPASATIYEGGSATFSVSATSSRPITYSWKKNGVAIGSSSKFAITSAKLSDAGTYSCSVSDGVKTLSCNNASLAVNQIVRITKQPVSQMLSEGASANLSVSATGTGPISYQWYRNGSAVSGATSNTLNIAATTTGHSGSYHCVVRNAGSTATSSTASLSIAAVVKTGSALISWKAPTTRADGSALALSKIAGYDLYHSASSANGLTKLTTLQASELSVVVDDLEAGTHYFALTTRDADGLESAKSTTFTVSIK